MARPPLAIGTAGKIKVTGAGAAWRARCRFRDYDGVVRAMERNGTTKSGAERALKEAVRDRVRVDPTAEINPDTKLSIVAEAWWAGFSLSDKSPGTKRIYRERLDAQIIPSVGNIRCRELSVGTAERFLRAVEAKHGPALTKTARSVLSNVCSYAARLDAMTRNPVRDTSPISVKPKKGKPRALTAAGVRQLRAYVTYDQVARRRDIPDLIDIMAATGMRVGEALALVWDAVNLDAKTVEVRGTVIRIKGAGLIIKPEPKTEAGYRTLILPDWAITVLRTRRHQEALNFGELGLVFPSAVGTLRDPSNVDHQIKDAFVYAGLPDLTSHVLRKTVATLMDEAGLTARQAADQLGHAKVSMTQDTYFARKTLDTGAAKALDILAFENA
ncbi:tyrosine-type recombinase/integrase [Actinoplanes bogorensis]|uniref:Tyrosine-type recombinase/integrase n=1 Tax=Paractinoplanes bogorensis TaxID=1610840 RepID=A0ABS5Z2J8_9ACTN|nr:site-specific integrase [Actinoplanes bogorensis]MBU2669927.1 tyrosine-type recombinase/integrase [Actinoplanes bogorensis]